MQNDLAKDIEKVRDGTTTQASWFLVQCLSIDYIALQDLTAMSLHFWKVAVQKAPNNAIKACIIFLPVILKMI